jgi:ApbE superfamily uncharacterized protein (UPF0280 family)
MIKEISAGKVYVEYGPVQMVVEATCHQQPMPNEVHEAAGMVPEILNSLVPGVAHAKNRWPLLADVGDMPEVLRRMLDSVASTHDETLTPMAAVAGTFADIVADHLVENGATRVIVNNGGDIAVRLESEESTVIGIAPRSGGAPPTHFIRLDSNSGVGGVTTSGLGGRSLTLGVADAVVAVAHNASVADACSTLIANHTYVVCPQVQRRLACEIDPQSDIADMWVTTRVNNLPEWAVEEALARGMSKAIDLIEEEVLTGSVVFVGGKVAIWPEGLIRPITIDQFKRRILQ